MGHTPGPWEVRPGYGMLKAEVGPHGQAVATVWVRQAGTREEQKEPVAWPEGEANAHLIAAVPDLYVACQMALFRLNGGAVHADADTLRTVLNAALAKASA